MTGPAYHARTHRPGGTDPITGWPLDSGGVEGNYEERVLANPNLIAYWPLSDASAPALDVSGNLQHLDVETGTPVYQVDGPMPGTTYPYAIEFTGVGGAGGSMESLHRDDGVGAEFDFSGTDPFTIEIMAYPTSHGSGFIELAMVWLGSGSSVIAFDMFGASYPNVGKVVCKGVTSTAALNLSEWTHVAVTYDGTATDTVRFYFDGAAVGTGTGNGDAAGGDVAQLGGGQFSANSHYAPWIGRLAHAAVYDAALSAAEIADHAAGVTITPVVTAGYVWTADGAGSATWEAPAIEVSY